MLKINLLSTEKEKIGLILIVSYFIIPEISLLLIVLYFFVLNQEKKIYYLKEKIKDFVSILLFFIPIIYIISLTTKALLPDYQEQRIVNEIKQSGVISMRLITSILITAPIIEEIIFRSILYRYLKKYTTMLCSSIIVAVSFSIIHQNILASTVLFTLSIFLTIVYEKFGNILFPIAVHILFNSIMLILMLYN